jgi:hypothetical protein
MSNLPLNFLKKQLEIELSKSNQSWFFELMIGGLDSKYVTQCPTPMSEAWSVWLGLDLTKP